jgi:hypothetical protein
VIRNFHGRFYGESREGERGVQQAAAGEVAEVSGERAEGARGAQQCVFPLLVVAAAGKKKEGTAADETGRKTLARHFSVVCCPRNCWARDFLHFLLFVGSFAELKWSSNTFLTSIWRYFLGFIL